MCSRVPAVARHTNRSSRPQASPCRGRHSPHSLNCARLDDILGIAYSQLEMVSCDGSLQSLLARKRRVCMLYNRCLSVPIGGSAVFALRLITKREAICSLTNRTFPPYIPNACMI
jgi:hypothetical protein